MNWRPTTEVKLPTATGWLCGLLTVLCATSQVWGYRDDSPEVQAIIAKAVQYIQTAERTGNGRELGGECLIAMAIYKYNKKFGGQTSSQAKSHPFVKGAIDRALGSAKGGFIGVNNYSLGIAMIFLTEVNPEASELEAYLQEMLKRQKPHGGWGYPAESTGDTSQTQYAVLGLWSAYKTAGLNVPVQSLEKVCNWLMRTQDPAGDWGYQGRDPGSFNRVGQTEKTISLAAAGLGSTYVCADYLGFSKGDKSARKRIPNLPPALIPVFEADEAGGKRKGGPVATVINAGQLTKTLGDGNKWFSNNMEVRTGDWQYYYLYALERYKSFQEIVEGRFEEEPKWYNDGVDFMKRAQQANGSFKVEGVAATAGAPVDTAFAALFLLRSTKETIARVVKNEGLLVGGYGLPSDTSNIRLTRDNKIVKPALQVATDQLMSMLEDENSNKLEELLANPDAISFSSMKGAGTEFTSRLRRTLRSGGWQARILAAKALGRQGDLDNVPYLIFGLTDPDPRVRNASRDGLRLTSRKLQGFNLVDEPNERQVEDAVDKWKQWYRSIRPDAAFLQ